MRIIILPVDKGSIPVADDCVCILILQVIYGFQQ